MNQLIDMTYSKSTKHTHVYKAVGSEAAIETIYVKNKNLPTPAPDTIKVTMSYEPS